MEIEKSLFWKSGGGPFLREQALFLKLTTCCLLLDFLIRKSVLQNLHSEILENVDHLRANRVLALIGSHVGCRTRQTG